MQYSECPDYSSHMPPAPTIAPTELDRVIHAHGDLRILDVRTPGEFETGHIAGAYNLPLGDLTDVIDELREVTDRIIVVCQSGARADQACHALQEARRAGPPPVQPSAPCHQPRVRHRPTAP